MAKTLSGVSWVSKFPTSTSTGTLADPFRSNVRNFLAALDAAGATVAITATMRPKERAFLMHWSFRIAREGRDPENVPPMAGVDIDWVHRDAQGSKSLPLSKAAAEQMVAGYDIAFRPALNSRHTDGLAIDMDIAWSAELSIEDGSGQVVTITAGAKDGSNPKLHQVGKSYGVVKLVTDPPHWSTDGH